MLLMTLVWDYFLWQGNPVGYYISNLFFFTACVLLLYTFARQITSSWGPIRSAVTGLFAASLFAASPLHCESISWVVGRVDSQCCLFYLAALCSFLRSRTASTAKWTIAGVVFFILAICSKEMAIGLAPVLACIGFLWTKTTAPSLKERVLSAWNLSKSIWIATAVYFGIRYLTLGTLLGGYAGSVGASQSANAISKWMDGDSWKRLFLPFSNEVFSPANSFEPTLFTCYCIIAGLVFIRAIAGNLPWKTLAFLGFWGLTCLAPIYRLFGIGANLEGARFCFFFSMTVSMLIPVLLFAPDRKLPAPLSLRLSVVSALVLSLATFVLAKAAYASNIVWLHAGKEVRAVLNDAVGIAKTASPTEQIALLGIPKQYGGAHMILNGSTFQMLLSPPFADKQYWKPFLTFDPILFGDESQVNGQRLRDTVSSQKKTTLRIWNSKSKHFEEASITGSPSLGQNSSSARSLTVPSAAAEITPYALNHARYKYEDGALKISQPNNGDGILLSDLHLNPFNIGYVKVKFRSDSNNIKLPFELRWLPAQAEAMNSSSSAPDWKDENSVRTVLLPEEGFEKEGSADRTVLLPVGRKWRWYSSQQIKDLALILPACSEISIREISLLPAEAVAPTVKVTGAECNNSGAYVMSKSFALNISSKDSKTFEIQLSKNNHFFENFDASNEALAVETTIPANTKPLALSSAQLKGPGYYQIRARALDKNAKPIGDFSDTVTIWTDH